MQHVHDCPTEGCTGYFECNLDGCDGKQDRPCYVCMERERDEALNRFEVLQDLSDQMAYSAGLSARRMEQAQQARDEALKERNKARTEIERLREVVRQVHALTEGALEVTNSMWVTTKIDAALREIRSVTKG